MNVDSYAFTVDHAYLSLDALWTLTLSLLWVLD